MTATTEAPRATPPKPRPTMLAEEFAFFRRHSNARIEAGAVLVALAARMVVGSGGAGDIWVVVFLLAVQPFFEWSFHVYVLHYRPLTVFGRTVDFELARKHRDHHADPTDVELIFVPLRSLVKIIPLGVLVALVVAPTLAGALTAMTVSAALLLAYEWVHYLIHSRYRPKSKLFRALWRAHRLHHYKNEQYWFGVTNPTADYVLRTSPAPSSVATSPTARDLAAR